jgi:hypothetical protein
VFTKIFEIMNSILDRNAFLGVLAYMVLCFLMPLVICIIFIGGILEAINNWYEENRK